MDNDLFGGPAPKTPLEEAWHNEQNRKKYDIIRVKNPTGEDFYVQYDVNQYQKVAANSIIDIPQYIAVRYVEHMKDKLVNDTNKKMHDEFIAQRRVKGFPDFKDKAVENAETYDTASYPKGNDPRVINEIYSQLWIGLVHEFGRDVPPTGQNPRSGEVDMTSVSMKALENLQKRRVAPEDLPPVMSITPTPQTVAPQAPVASVASVFSVLNEKLDPSEVTNE